MTTKKDGGAVAHIESQEDWDKLMKFNGLLIADIYQDWNGPCKPLVSLFNKLHVQISNECIKFVQVKVDNIRSLQMYKGKSEPTFLLFGTGQLVGVIRGVNAPIMKELCLRKFEEELQVLKGEIERIVIRDPGILRLESTDEALAEDLFNFVNFEMTFAIIKPDIVAKNQHLEIIEKLKDEGFNVIQEEIRQISKEEVLSMFNALRKEDYIEEVITYMTTGKSCLLALECEFQNSVAKLKEIIGDEDVEIAKRTMPESLRAMFGLSGYRNGIHAADSREEAIKSISLTFPDLVSRKNFNDEDNEKTVMIIPANIYNEHMKSIMQQLNDAELNVINRAETSLAKVDIVHLFKRIFIQKDLIIERVEEMYGSKFTVLLFKQKNCLKTAKYLLNLYTPVDDEIFDYKKLLINDLEVPDLIYVSDDRFCVIRDINYFFPVDITFAIIKPDAYEQRDEIIKLIKLAGFSIPIAFDLTLSIEIIEEIYRNCKNMPFHDQLLSNMSSGPCITMVLSKNNAVMDWRDIMGSINPEDAAEQSPDKLRGIFGSTLIENALHGASNKDDALRCIYMIFGNIQFDERGNVCGHTIENHFNIKIFLPSNIDENRISDVLSKLCVEGVYAHKSERELSLTQIATLYSTIKSFDSYPNLKCFIITGGNIIPVILHEENLAWEKLDKINSFPKTHKNFEMRKDLWKDRFSDETFVLEKKYVIYKLDNEMSRTPTVEEIVFLDE